MIVLPTSSIINIIEVGDYVNGNKVDDIDYNAQIVYCNEYNLDDSLIRYRKDEIRYIVTNKLFENTEYEVE